MSLDINSVIFSRTFALVTLILLCISGCGAKDESKESPAKALDLFEFCVATEQCVSDGIFLDSGVFTSPSRQDKVVEYQGLLISAVTINLKFTSNDRDDLEAILDTAVARVSAYVPSVDFLSIQLPDGELSSLLSVVEQLEKLPGVAWAAPNCFSIARLEDNESFSPPEGYDGLGLEEGLWGFDKIGLGEVHDKIGHLSLNSVTVAVLDSSFDLEHPELSNRFLAGFDFADGDENPTPNDIADDVPDFDGLLYHGTAVSGIIAAENNGHLINGVAPAARLLPMKVFSSFPPSQLELVLGDNWAFLLCTKTIVTAMDESVNRGADVVNMSFGLVTSHSWVRKPLQELVDVHSGSVLFVAAAGNDAMDTTDVLPASLEGVVSVGATTDSDERWQKSNYSKTDAPERLTMAAPGKNILVLTALKVCGSCSFSDFPNCSNCLRVRSGTSLASPMVAGVAALLLQIDPKLSPDGLKKSLIDSAISVEVEDPNGKSHSWKRLNALAAVEFVANSAGIQLDPQDYDPCDKHERLVIVEKEVELPVDDMGYVTIVDGVIYILHESGEGAQLQKMSTSGELLGSYESPISSSNTEWINGIEFDGASFWLALGGTNRLVRMNLVAGQLVVLDSIDLPGSYGLVGPVWNGETLFVYEGEENSFFAVDPDTGAVEKLGMHFNTPSSLCWANGTYLMATGGPEVMRLDQQGYILESVPGPINDKYGVELAWDSQEDQLWVFGYPHIRKMEFSCNPKCKDQDEDGFTTNCDSEKDCDDSDADIYPNKWEECDNKDNDCDGEVDEIAQCGCIDKDGDGWGFGCGDDIDCDDGDPNIHPGKKETCDGVDNNCKGGVDEGLKKGPFGCLIPGKKGLCKYGDMYETCSWGSWDESDCEQVNFPEEEECDNKDNDCDGEVDEVWWCDGDCEPLHDEIGCKGEQVWWFNACDDPEDYIKTCAADEKCEGGKCIDDSVTGSFVFQGSTPDWSAGPVTIGVPCPGTMPACEGATDGTCTWNYKMTTVGSSYSIAIDKDCIDNMGATFLLALSDLDGNGQFTPGVGEKVSLGPMIMYWSLDGGWTVDGCDQLESNTCFYDF